MAETTVTISMRRSDGHTPWGFRIQGGQEFGTPISIAGVVQGSLSDRAGLQVGDKLCQLQGNPSKSMTHKQGQDLISSAASSLDLVVSRLGGPISSGSLSQTAWNNMSSMENRSHVTSSQQSNTYQAANKVNTSLQQHRQIEQSRIPGYNVSASPWGTGSQPYTPPATAHPPASAPPPVPTSAPPPPQQLSPRPAPPSQPPPKIIHAQYNSPAGLYSSKSTAEEYLHQTGGLFGTDPSLQQKEEPSFLRSETLRLIQESEHGGGGRQQKQQPLGRRSPIPGYAEGREQTLHETDAQSGSFKRLSHALGSEQVSSTDQSEPDLKVKSVSSRVASYQQNITEGAVPQGYGGPPPPGPGGDEQAPGCDVCGRSILGVYCKAGGRSLHPECFNCSTCGTNLKNTGYFNVNNKLYCETHAKQVQGPILGSRPAIDPNAFNTSYPMPTSNKNAEPTRAFYQPEILKPGPLGKVNPPAASWRGRMGGASSLSPSSRGIPQAPSMYTAPTSDLSTASNYNSSYSASYKSSTMTSNQQNGISYGTPVSTPIQTAPAQPKPAPMQSAPFSSAPAPFSSAPQQSAPFSSAQPPSSAPFSSAPPPSSAPFSSAPPPIGEQEQQECDATSEYDIPSGVTTHGCEIEEQEQQYYEQYRDTFERSEQDGFEQREPNLAEVIEQPTQQQSLQFENIPQKESQFYADPSSSEAYIVLESPLPYPPQGASKQTYDQVENPYKSELLDMIQQDEEEAKFRKNGNPVKYSQKPTWHPPPLATPVGGRPECERRNSITNIQWPPAEQKEVVPSWRLQSLNGQERVFGRESGTGVRPGDPDYLKVIWYRKSQYIKEREKRPPSPLREMMRRDGLRASLPPNFRSKQGPPKFGSSQLQGLGMKEDPKRDVPDDAYGPFVNSVYAYDHVQTDKPAPLALSPKMKLDLSREQYADRLKEMGIQQRQDSFGEDDAENENIKSRITVNLHQNSVELNAAAEDLVDAACEMVQHELKEDNVIDSTDNVADKIDNRDQIDHTVDALLNLAHDIDDVALKLASKSKSKNQSFAQSENYTVSSSYGLKSSVNQENVMPVFAPRSFRAWGKQDSLESHEVAMTMRRDTEVIQQGQDQVIRQVTHQSIRPNMERRTETPSGKMESPRPTIVTTSPAGLIQLTLNEQIRPGTGAKWTPTAESGGKTSGSVQPRRGKGILKQSHELPRIPVCESCHREIRGPFILAMNKTWDPDCFVCANAQCHRKLQDIGFVEENGQNYCEICFENYLAPQCAKCFKPVTGDCLNALDRQWHPQCFACAHCGKVFGNAAFYLEEGKAYCETDWNNLFTTKCVACEFAIEAGDRWVEALGHAYHSECFQCTTCSKPLEGQSFYAKGGHPYCKTHA